MITIKVPEGEECGECQFVCRDGNGQWYASATCALFKCPLEVEIKYGYIDRALKCDWCPKEEGE